MQPASRATVDGRRSPARITISAQLLLRGSELQQDAAKRDELFKKAKLRAELAFDSRRPASEGVVMTARGDTKSAAQSTINAALGVLRGAINHSIGVAIL
jgi:hypothetical protein